MRSRSCFAEGEISRVTVWFVNGRHISSTPAVVNVTSGEGETGGTACAACILTHQRKRLYDKRFFALEMPTHTTYKAVVHTCVIDIMPTGSELLLRA